jgi:nitroimidazol reductase NimA-like FMN-containing flavoprotein (pyridoxamine 5'-phosphate oxidase superfamily)
VTHRNTGRSTAAAELEELDRGECLRLLGGNTVGRVLFTEGALPAAHPVTYLLDGEQVIFRTAAGGKLAAATRHHVVGFQADEIDPHTRIGWSVLGVGETYEVVTPTRLAELAARQPAPWFPDRTGHTIAIPLQRLTGRRMHPTDTECSPGE